MSWDIMKSSRRKKYTPLGIVFILSVLLIITWFSPLNFHVFMGDDLSWIKAYHSSEFGSGYFWHDVFTLGNNIGKIRPVSTGLLLLSTEMCKDSFDCFISINYFIFIINTSLFSLVAYKITNHWRTSILITPLVLIFSRFSYYSVLQVMGLMENLAMTLVLLFALCFIYYMRTGNAKWMMLIILIFLVAICTHERFIVLIVPILFSLIVKKKMMRWTEFILLSFILLLVTSGYFGLRQYFVPGSFLTGTGGTTVADTFKLSQVASFVGQGILNLIGFNAGPDYLSGKFFLDAGVGGILVGCILTGSLTILICIFIYEKLDSLRKSLVSQESQRRRGFTSLFSKVSVCSLVTNARGQLYKEPEFELGLVLILMIGGLILAGSITIRQEYRWLYAPFAIFVLLVFFLLSKISSQKIRYILALMIVISFVSVDIFYRQFVSNIFFIDGLRTASSVKSEIIDKYSVKELSQNDIYILIGNKTVIQTWYLQDDFFFKLYTNNPGIKVYYSESLDSISIANLQSKLSLVFQINGDQVIEISQDTIQDAINDNIALSGYITEYDFITNFPSGNLRGQPIFIMAWLDTRGLINQTITLTSPSTIRYNSVSCQRDSKIIFRAGMPYTAGDGANLYIEIKSEGSERLRVIEVPLKPAQEETIINWSAFSVPISSCTGEPVSIIFGVESPSGDQSYDWVALANLKLVFKK